MYSLSIDKYIHTMHLFIYLACMNLFIGPLKLLIYLWDRCLKLSVVDKMYQAYFEHFL
jgi:hypothetical protein